MGKFNTARVANVLATYAVRRLMGYGQDRLGDGFCQPETRHEWIRDILQGMAEVCGQNPAPFLQSFDQRLETACGASAVEVLTPDSQRHMIQSLGWYASALGRMEGDQRARLSAVKKLLEDVSAYLPWDVGATGVYPARDEVEQALLCAVAQRPIRFTRVLLGGERDPGGVEFLPGMVNDVETVRRTQEFQRLTLEYPKREEWPALCMVCMGGGRQSDAHTIDADGLDMAVIRECGERFMERPEVRPVWMHELTIPVQGQNRVVKTAPEEAAESSPSCGDPDEPTQWEFHVL